jgi:hypothetical protein
MYRVFILNISTKYGQVNKNVQEQKEYYFNTKVATCNAWCEAMQRQLVTVVPKCNDTRSFFSRSPWRRNASSQDGSLPSTTSGCTDLRQKNIPYSVSSHTSPIKMIIGHQCDSQDIFKILVWADADLLLLWKQMKGFTRDSLYFLFRMSFSFVY